MPNARFFCKSLMLIALSGIWLLSGCSDDATSTSTSTSQIYNGPGSKWDLQLKDDGTFHIDHRPDVVSAIDFTVDGTYLRHDSGFITLLVTGGEGANAPAAGSAAWALEAPGYAFMLKPLDGEQLIAMVTAGECPTGNLDVNWVIVKQDKTGGTADANNSGRDFAGTFHYDFATGVPTIPFKKALSTDFPDVSGGGIDPGDVVCANGIMNIPGAVMYLTANGGAIVHTDNGTPADEADDQIIFGQGQKAITNAADSDGDYAGMLFDESMSDGSKLNPVSLSCTSGTCIATLVTDVITGATSSDSVTITLSNAINEIGGTSLNGFMTGTISDGLGTGNMICMVDPNAVGSGKKIISCVGQSPGDVNKIFNVLFVSR